MAGVTQEDLDKMVAACHRAGAEGLLRCSSGNMSWRAAEGLMAVTGRGTWLGRIERGQLAVARINDGQVLNNVTPSVESGFHRGVMLARPDVNVVFHFQPPFATAFACGPKPGVDFNVIPEIPYYIGAIGWVDYLPPGSPELADEVIRVLRGCDLALLRNHGLVTVGKDFDDALQKAAFFELACGILASGVKTAPLTAEAVAALRNKGQAARKI